MALHWHVKVSSDPRPIIISTFDAKRATRAAEAAFKAGRAGVTVEPCALQRCEPPEGA